MGDLRAKKPTVKLSKIWLSRRKDLTVSTFLSHVQTFKNPLDCILILTLRRWNSDDSLIKSLEKCENAAGKFDFIDQVTSLFVMIHNGMCHSSDDDENNKIPI